MTNTNSTTAFAMSRAFRSHKGRKFWMDRNSTVGDLLEAGFRAGKQITFHHESGKSLTGALVGARCRGFETTDLKAWEARKATEALVQLDTGENVRVLVRQWTCALG